MLHKRFLLRRRFVLVLLGLGAALTPLMLNYYVNAVTSSRRYTEISQVPEEDVAVVFGAGVWEDGSPTPMLADRVQAAVDLYKAGRVRKVLMTGDNSSKDYNEVKAMQEYAADRGVPAKDIQLDYAGFSTYESCYRAKEIFGVKRAVLITQSYHLPRAVYTCRHLGVDAVGLGTPDWEKFRDRSMMRYATREVLAVIKALWEVHVTRPEPTFLGPFEGIK
ncbi:ElyC/SanA/YdcF family protein [Microcoleus sp. FACHB-68]|uniref:SanA/YdcF family protein n=1 Tax=Microcoleus sp. FACHB-68 TaxID=2692826 RepID=UPI00168825B0|nr:ElyC/SanA/YdcF family protein [Microcoleus sp. FACHB-68]MBD1940472.1 YdcF family protein [Microcoleus sp. FACHB-68]